MGFVCVILNFSLTRRISWKTTRPIGIQNMRRTRSGPGGAGPPIPEGAPVPSSECWVPLATNPAFVTDLWCAALGDLVTLLF